VGLGRTLWNEGSAASAFVASSIAVPIALDDRTKKGETEFFKFDVALSAVGQTYS